MAKKKRIPDVTGPRNHLHNHPLLGKSGAHQQSTKAKRQHDKVKLKREWSQVSVFALTCGHFAESKIKTTELAIAPASGLLCASSRA